MPRNGIGSYALPAGNPVVTGTTISSSTMNTTLNDIAAALTQSVSADGQTPFTGPIQFFVGSTLSASPAVSDNSTKIATTAYTVTYGQANFVKQGGGPGQGTNKVNLGWDSAQLLRLAIDNVDFGNIPLMIGRPNTWTGPNTYSSIPNFLNGISFAGTDLFMYPQSNGLNFRLGPASAYVFVGMSAVGDLSGLRNGTFSGTLSATTVTQTSDERLKTNWQSVPDGLIAKMATVLSGSYDLKAGSTNLIGVSAQELQTVMPQAIANDEQGYLSVNYGAASLVSVIELCKEVVSLQARLAALEAK